MIYKEPFMQIQFKLTEEDFLNFNLYHVKHSKTATRALRLQQFLIPLLYVLAAFIFSMIGDMPFLFLLVPFLVLSVVWIFLAPKFFYSSVMRNVKKMLKEGKAGGITGNYTMTLTEEGLAESTPIEEKKTRWDGITSFQEDDDYFYLYNSAVSAYILPKRALKNIGDIRALLQSKVNI